ncbi:MAG: sigma 54-interacting transcriptional regulator [Spirochaetales bacterium]|uniref:HTH-type transcriptional regulatory protein TyrR n=1 Tax=Candidatus Thalassospirochaeta sargassi TaxID=3119039 RepID=A0AAJ1IG30_9SPIO|nr:sigma 54-interacting transcriptional regulator [Spirochaetales bacterium]
MANFENPEEYLEQLVGEYEPIKKDKVDIFSFGDAIDHGIYVIDENGIITHANKQYQKLTGMWEKEYLGKPVAPILSKFFHNSRAVATESLKTGKKLAGLSRPRRTDCELLVTSLPIKDDRDKTTMVITVLQDVTEEIKLQKKFDKNLEKTEQYEQELNYYRTKEAETSVILGSSPGMDVLKNLIVQIAPVDTTILLTGETGTGKEIISREIHNRSPRAEKPYIAVNCAAIPESLIESELFGYEKGAFTGAINQKKAGYFETANKGTLLLDEIGEIPLNLQSKLLRVLQEKEITRIGGTKPTPLDIRIIAATNKNLKKEVKEGRFRKDLYFRLCVIPLHIPPLRERTADIPSLAEKFLSLYNKKHNTEKYFSQTAVELFKQYDWPGNVRELENIVERLIVISRSNEISEIEVSAVIGPELISDSVLPEQNMDLKTAVANLEKRMIEKALKETGSSYDAAEILGIDQSTVIRKAQKLGISGW